jgi:amino acid transporter
MILAAASINDPSYTPTNYQTFLLTVFLMVIHATMSSLPTRWLAQINSGGSTFNFLALITVIILIPAGTDRESRGLPRFTPSSDVWGTIYPGTTFPPGISVLMSFIGVIWTMSGYDSPFHLAEECSNAALASPRAIVLTSATGGLFGWFLQLVVAYTVVDITGVLESDLGQPFAAYLMQCMSQRVTLAILTLTIIAGFSMGQGCMIAASRVTFAYARDDCFPLSRWWKQVNPYTQTPVNAVWLNCVVGILCLLLIFGGELAVGALFSIGAIAAFVYVFLTLLSSPFPAPSYLQMRRDEMRQSLTQPQRLHNPNLHPRLPRRRPLPPGALAPRPLLAPHWRHSLRIRHPHGPHPLLPQRHGRGPHVRSPPFSLFNPFFPQYLAAVH